MKNIYIIVVLPNKELLLHKTILSNKTTTRWNATLSCISSEADENDIYEIKNILFDKFNISNSKDFINGEFLDEMELNTTPKRKVMPYILRLNNIPKFKDNSNDIYSTIKFTELINKINKNNKENLAKEFTDMMLFIIDILIKKGIKL